MTFPIDIHFGSVVFSVHLLTDILSLYIGYRYYVYLRKQKGDHLSFDTRFSILIGAATGALLGSRLLAYLEHIQTVSYPTFVYIFSIKTIVGGIIGGILGVEIVKKILKIKSASGDLITFPLILGIVVGRVGCFLSGVRDGVVGNVSAVPWAFDQGDGLPRHPTALYEILFLVSLFFMLRKISMSKTLKQGVLFRLFIISYLGFRFLIEFLKPVDSIFIGLSSIQIASLVFALYYIYTVLFTSKYSIISS